MSPDGLPSVRFAGNKLGICKFPVLNFSPFFSVLRNKAVTSTLSQPFLNDEIIFEKGLIYVKDRHAVLLSYPHRSVSIGITCFLRDITPGRKTILSFGSTLNACRIISSFPT